MGDFDWMRRADNPHRSPGSQHLAPQGTWEADQQRGLVARGRIMFLGIVILVASWELGSAIAAAAEPSVIRLVLIVGLLYATWRGGAWAVLLAVFVLVVAAVDRFVLAATKGDPLELGLGIAMAGIAACLVFSKSLEAFFRHQRGAGDRAAQYVDPQKDAQTMKTQTVVYTARTLQDAHLLKNMLADAGIEALVINDVLEGGSGVDVVGWATAARVVVEEKDAEVARQMARDFDRPNAAEEAALAGEPEDWETSGGQSYQWPRCPQCDVPRPTRCPICQTIGSDFPQADAEFVGLLDPQEPAGETSCGCCKPGASCGEGAAAAGRSGVEQPPDQPAEQGGPEAKPPATLLVCPTCDEPFLPEFPRRCAWCDYEFEDGVEIGPGDQPPEQIGTRAVAVMFGIVALLTLLVVYFVFLL